MSSEAPLTPDHLFDRPWRPGRRFRRGAGRVRRWGMGALLVVLCLIIGAYVYITDSSRVRAMAESYLSELVGGPVKVGGATLSVFEGLRLDDVRLFVDDDDRNGARDSLLFSAQTLLIKYDPGTMIAGKLEATQIVAQKPQVHLAENRDRGDWNFERLLARRRDRARPAVKMPKRMALPEILLRNARVTISEIRGGREVARGVMGIDGRLVTTPDGDRYTFHLQSRGASQGYGPYASGSVSLTSGDAVAQLMNFQFGDDVQSMFPAEPRDWCRRHELAGAISMPEINFARAKDGQAEQFRFVTVLHGVTLSVRPEEWMGRSEVARLTSMRKSASVMSALYRHTGALDDDASPAARVTRLLTPSKITLKNVGGTFVFSNSGIEVKDVSGFVERNGLKINGRIDGYSPDAPMSLRLSSLDTENLVIPAAPRYVSSLPREVREVYEQFKPEGECRLDVRLERGASPDARPVVSGSVQIVDGRFVFNRFPYPMRNVTGRIDFGHADDGTGKISLNVRGNGPADGPNRDAVLEIKTFGDAIGPVATNVCGVNVRISGTGVSSDEVLSNAFPVEVRRALANLDAHRTGKYPTYRGDFVTEVVRPVGPKQRWTFDTDITLTDGNGALAAFPYPLHDMKGKVLIRNGYAELVDMHTPRLKVSGRIAWGTGDAPPPAHRAKGAMLSPRASGAVKTELKVAIRDMPIDNALLAAIPKERREWVRKLGASGKLDVDGRVFAASRDKAGGADVEWVVGEQRDKQPAAVASTSDTAAVVATTATPALDYDLRLTVRDATLRPFGRSFEATGVEAVMRLTTDALTIEKASAKRGDGALGVSGKIDWPRGKTRVVLDATGEALALDDALYDLLPEPARQAWDETQPQGTLDAAVHYDSSVIDPREASAAATTRPTTPAGLRVVLKPRQLKVTLKSMPYTLEKLVGTITVEGNRVTIDDVAGHHGDAKITVAGTGVLGATRVWDLRIGGERVPIDEPLRTALPEALSSLIESLKLEGTVGFNLTKFNYRSTAAATSAKTDKESEPEDTPAEIDVIGSLQLAGGKLDVGVPISDVSAVVKIDAAVREGHLHTLTGGINFDSMTMAGRPAKNFRAELLKPEGKGELRLNKMRCDIAGGTMSGDMTVVYPEEGPSRYALELVVRDADVRQLAWEKEDTVKGRLTASLSLEGSWGDAAKRRGRGDVIVEGRDMYRIPLVLGLLQVTNLTLPISSPFNEATAVYSLEGSRVVFEQIKFKSKNMLMEGNGSLDYSTKKVDLAFTTDTPGGLMKLPFLKELWRGARNEMLRIRVRGTIQEPQVSAQSMGTFWTTVDEVFNGDGSAEKKRSR